ncbi:MAG TPA: tetratricopeptide repeat protein [Candidatus Aquilonibacter sp.]|nr:tetratricopeptide repeat protein [Candidatus Aquilonibacter sp.]
MKKLIRMSAMLVVALLLASAVKAQDGRVAGQVFDIQGIPWPGVTVNLKSDTGRTFTLTTDKDGKYSQIGVPNGNYVVTLTNAASGLNFHDQRTVAAGQDNVFNYNFKEIAAKQGPSPEEVKKHEDEQNLFKQMAQHFNAGKAALDDSNTLGKQLATEPADQKSATQDKINADYQTAITELQQAEQGVQAKDTKNHAVVWATLGQAYDGAGRYDDAVNAYQKAIEMSPQASYYADLSTAVVNAAVAQTDTSGLPAKVTEAGTDCDKATALDPTMTARCWKNIGIVLQNKNQLPAAVVPFQKATAADPKDAQSWFLLGGALSSQITSTQKGNQITYTFPPGLVDAYENCIKADPNGPYAPQAKATLDGLNQLSGGTSTIVNERKKK